MLPARSSNISATELKCGGKSCVSAYPMQGNSMRDKGHYGVEEKVDESVE